MSDTFKKFLWMFVPVILILNTVVFYVILHTWIPAIGGVIGIIIGATFIYVTDPHARKQP